MNDEGQSSGHYFLEQAQKALNRRDREQTRRWAALAAEAHPELEEPWLILAAISEPNDSILYLKRALEANPGSHRARKGMHWAVQRQRVAQAQAHVAPAGEETQPVKHASVPLAATAPIRVQKTSKRSKQRSRWVLALLPMLAAIVVLASSIIFLTGFRPVWTVFASGSSAPRPLGVLAKPTLTPTSTPTARYPHRDIHPHRNCHIHAYGDLHPHRNANRYAYFTHPNQPILRSLQLKNLSLRAAGSAGSMWICPIKWCMPMKGMGWLTRLWFRPARTIILR
jgi:hypothetical protein